MSTACNIPPKGWKCTRDKGHEGPCAAVRVKWYQTLGNSIGEAVGQFLFGGSR